MIIYLKIPCTKRCGFCNDTYTAINNQNTYNYQSIFNFIKRNNISEIIFQGINVCEFNDNGMSIVDMITKLYNDLPFVKQIEVIFLNIGCSQIKQYIDLCAAHNISTININLQGYTDDMLYRMNIIVI
jgi:lipoate synthase